MATPYVTAAAALLMAGQPDRTPAQVTKRLRESATRVSGMNGASWNEELGSGLLNLEAALR